MTKRTKTNFYFSKGLEKFIELLACYKNGCVGIVYQDEKMLDKVSKALYENGNTIKCKHINETDENSFDEYVRYFIGIGDKDVIEKTQIVAGDNLYCYYCLDIVPDFFSNGLLMNLPYKRFAEFAYFDSDIFNLKDTKLMASGYATLFSLLISLYDIYCLSIHKPYKDTTLEMLIKKIKSFLLYKSDIDLYYAEMISLIKRSTDWLNRNKEFPLIYRIRFDQRNNWCEKREFFIAYLLFYLGLIFTKWDFNDMLIPVATPSKVREDLVKFIAAYPTLFEKLFISRQQLGYIAGIYRTMSDRFDSCNLYKAMTLIKRASAQTNGLFAQIHKKGIIEGLINYEEH